MFGTTRTLSESLLDIGEGVTAILIAAALAYVGGRWLWPFVSVTCRQWWQERSQKSARAALASLEIEIQTLNESKTNLLVRQNILLGAMYDGLQNLIGSFAWGTFAGITLLLTRLAQDRFFLATGRILSLFLAGAGIITLYRWAFQRRKIEELLKLDDLLVKLEKHRERLRARAAL